MKISKFEDLIVWQKSGKLIILIFKLFKKCHNHSFKDQIQRAAISVMNNIAEGFEKQNNKEFRRYLIISKGSCGEVRSMLYIALKLKYISELDFKVLCASCCEISKML